MTYRETLDWMYAQLPMYQQTGKTAYTGKLDHILAFAKYLNHPEEKFKSIHVAGTNGKGSSSHMLASILQEAGYKVGLYTSPHLKDFRERIKINGKLISRKFVVDFIHNHEAFLNENRLSFFELTVGMAFDYFSQKKIDIAIVEVGLGGRLDSTNIITPEVSLITNIGYDHMDILGNTLTLIAKEKAGIIKKGVPVVISEYQEETATVFKAEANKKGAKLVFASEIIVRSPKVGLIGHYQSKNSKGVLAVLRELKGFPVTNAQLKSGLANVVETTGLLGRWQILKTNPKVICDTAHNWDGLALVTKQIQEEKFKTLHVVLGFVKDKKLETILPLFPINAIYYFCSPKISRGLDAKLLKAKATNFGLDGKVYSSVKNAYKAASKNADITDLIFIGGSTFVVAEVL